MGAVLFPPTIATKPTTYIFKQSFFINLYVCICVYKNKCKKKNKRHILQNVYLPYSWDIFHILFIFFLSYDAGNTQINVQTQEVFVRISLPLPIPLIILHICSYITLIWLFFFFFSRRCLTCSGSVIFFFLHGGLY